MTWRDQFYGAAIAIAAVSAAVMICGCQSLCEDYPDLPWCPAPTNAPPEPPDPPQPPGPPPTTGRWVPELIEEIHRPKVTAVECFEIDGEKHLAVSCANVFHGSHETEIRVYKLRGEQKPELIHVHTDGGETRGLWKNDGRLYATGEHRRNILKWNHEARKFDLAGPTRGGWSVIGFEGWAPFNDRYSGAFHDEPILVDADTGATLDRLPVKAMPRDVARWNGKLYIPCNYDGDWIGNLAVGNIGQGWDIYDSKSINVAVCPNGQLYLSGSSGAGPSAFKRADGWIRVYMGNGREVDVYDTEAYSVPDEIILQDSILWITVDWDRLVWQRGDNFDVVFRRKDSEKGKRDRSFGGFGDAESETRVWVCWSDVDRNRSYLYRFTWRAQ